MNGWLQVLVIFLAVITWYPVGMVSIRNLNRLYNYKSSEADEWVGWLGYLMLVILLFGTTLKAIGIGAWIVIVSLVEFFAGISIGGIPRWYRRQKEFARDLYEGFGRN